MRIMLFLMAKVMRVYSKVMHIVMTTKIFGYLIQIANQEKKNPHKNVISIQNGETQVVIINNAYTYSVIIRWLKIVKPQN